MPPVFPPSPQQLDFNPLTRPPGNSVGALQAVPSPNLFYRPNPLDGSKGLFERTSEALDQAAAGQTDAPPQQDNNIDARHAGASPSTAAEDFMHDPVAQWNEHNEKILLGPYDYMFGHPGKDIRAQMIAAFNAWLEVPPESLQVITRVVGMLHTASLLYVQPSRQPSPPQN